MNWDRDSILPIFELNKQFTFYCTDGFVTDDYETAKKHGLKSPSSVGFRIGDMFETFDYNVLPVINNISMEIKKPYVGFNIYYYTDDELFMHHELWYTSRDIENGKLKPLVGTPKQPYEYIDQGVNVFIFERDGYVMVVSDLDWEHYGNQYTGFRVKAEEFYKAWNKIDYPEPNK